MLLVQVALGSWSTGETGEISKTPVPSSLLEWLSSSRNNTERVGGGQVTASVTQGRWG